MSDYENVFKNKTKRFFDKATIYAQGLIKDDALPQKYRYSSMDSFISTGSISVDVQKSAIASKAIVALKNSTAFESYLLELEKTVNKFQDDTDVGFKFNLEISILLWFTCKVSRWK
jgi:hypothetical protein